MWKRGQKVRPPDRSFLDPTQYLPKFAKELVNEFLTSDNRQKWREIVNVVKKKKPFMASMLVYGVHQCCGSDKFRCCQMLLDLVRSDEVRTKIVNTPFGRRGYTPLHRACYNGSERMLKFMVCCGADVNVVSPEGETLLEVLRQGKEQQERESQYTLAKIINYSPRSQFYRLEMPNGNVNEYSSTLIDHQRKWVKPGHVYVHTPARKDDFIFVRERFRMCEKYIHDKQVFDQKAKSRPTKKRRLLLKPQAARILQVWWREKKRGGRSKRKKKKPLPPMTYEDFAAGKALSFPINADAARVLLWGLLKKGKMAEINRFKEQVRGRKTVFHRLVEEREIKEYAMDDCPALLRI